MGFEVDPRLRELCEKASKEMDHGKLIDLVRQINELIEQQNQGRSSGKDIEKNVSPVRTLTSAVLWICRSAPEVTGGALPGQLAAW